MFKTRKTNSLTHEFHTNQQKQVKRFSNKKISEKKPFIGIGIGVFLTLVTIALQCVAFFTPHWKEISPNTHSLYVDGVDALIRTEVLHYFNTIHRYSRHSYGLFQRCEYLLNNSSKYNNQQDVLDLVTNQHQKKCTKNYLPSYRDDYFNECHSLPYYRFCTKASERNFDIDNDYLRATFDISSLNIKSTSTISCDCQYPPYVLICHITGIIALLLLFINSLLFSSFLFFKNPDYRLKLKCFGVLTFVLSIIFLIVNLANIIQHLEYESIEYLIAIERHYKSNQIYKLSQDTKTAIDKFLLSINIRIGYSTILAWIALLLSFVNGILFFITCTVKHNKDEKKTRTNSSSSQNYHEKEIQANLISNSHHEEDHHTDMFTGIQNDSPSNLPPIISTENNFDKNYQPARMKDDEV